MQSFQSLGKISYRDSGIFFDHYREITGPEEIDGFGGSKNDKE